MREKRTFIDAIRVPRKVLENGWTYPETSNHPEELHNITLEGMIEGKKTAERPRNCYLGKIKCDANL